MCGRVRLSSDYSEIKIRLRFAPNSAAPNFEPDWNKPPTAPMLVAIRSVNGERIPKMMKWGLIPHWAKDDKLQFSTFNARAEEFTTKPAFRDAWARGQRCLVVTDGFYEWKKLDAKGKLKQPHAIAMVDDAQMVMAGLATRPSPGSGRASESCNLKLHRLSSISISPIERGCLRRCAGESSSDGHAPNFASGIPISAM